MGEGEADRKAREDSLTARLRRQLGGEVGFQLALDAEETATASVRSHSDEILERLEAHGLKETRYTLKDEIARGGMGAIIKVWDQDLRRNLAMKVVVNRDEKEEHATAHEIDPKTLGRFLEEAQVTAQLDHPGIVPVHELGIDDAGHVYFTMQLVKGRDLKAIFDLVFKGDERWNVTRALGVMLRVCEAMAYAHAKAVIHRDLKPSNVMVGRFGEVYVMDWGVARVLGREDPHDLHLQSDVTTMSMSIVKSELRDEVVSQGSTGTLYTMDGDVVGTPAYMSPEQARGEISLLDARTDVYAVGAMLYHLLTEQMPYVTRGARVGAHQILMRVMEGPPVPLHTLNPDVPAELAAICEKAMARKADDRYVDMQELAEDLAAFLEHRVVKAYETGAIAEFKKWVTRNKALAATSAAATILLLAGSLATSIVFARKNTALEIAEAEALTNEAIARRERDNVLRLSAFQGLEDLRIRANVLWPAHPDRIPELEGWMSEAEELIDGLDTIPGSEAMGFYDQRAALRGRAVPQTEEDRERQRRTHPRFAELVGLRKQLEALRLARRVRLGEAEPASFELDTATLQKGAMELNLLAWELVAPEEAEREEYGREAEGLALARRALERARNDLDRAIISDTMAWALQANGLDEEALATSRTALSLAPETARPEFEEQLARMEKACDSGSEEARQGEIEAVAAAVSQLEAEVTERHTWTFADDQDRWWHDQLAKLITEIESLADPESGLVQGVSPLFGWGVQRRLDFAREVEELTIRGDEARRRWDEAIASIGSTGECPAYGGLEISPQLGLLPLGRDPVSGLWEFAHVQTGEVPERAADGTLAIAEETCIVLVLIPGGTFAMGAQAGDPADRNYYAAAQADEGPVRSVTLSPYFLSKYEMTQGQWERIAGANPSNYDPTKIFGDKRHDLRHPVEGVSWEDCRVTLQRLGLVLPTEAQWEHAARAGTTGPRWTGDDGGDFSREINLADEFARENGGSATWKYEAWDDGYTVHAPAGTYRANPFGLHEILGNVWEWCRDWYDSYDLPVAEGDGARQTEAGRFKISRGGGYRDAAVHTRSALRGRNQPDNRSGMLGVRPARSLEE